MRPVLDSSDLPLIGAEQARMLRRLAAG